MFGGRHQVVERRFYMRGKECLCSLNYALFFFQAKNTAVCCTVAQEFSELVKCISQLKKQQCQCEKQLLHEIASRHPPMVVRHGGGWVVSMQFL